ncbi:MerR family transcriptional regulator [Paenibacillus radicis (ex Xue et al. 2023)]|uniref:MerR family transcriptional regulator n=1 Tax=Paenibacillus radicis (ex Xue et al. 2023) TaxID=2972489 RepID=A0ABT1YM81_9BACL|nr:MerR family transcriptional regulator [Paenibacillus radicis (ex Xue et al. 2023)]MCR8634283.1 MerR family transcriptional regulator [Paenibacillus radicis (ex Xue et al. 2023)]
MIQKMDIELTIQQVAARTGLSVHTLRYYERIGLMEPICRASNGHRSYKENDLEWIILLMRLRSTGMPISEMRRFADMMRHGDLTIAQRRQVLEEHEQKLLMQVQELQNTLTVLRDKIVYYRSWEAAQQQEEKSITG